MPENNLTIHRLLEANPLREPVLREVIGALRLPAGSRGLDVGCGIGLQVLLLAQAVGSEGQICGVDIDPDLLAYGEKLVEKAGFSARIRLREGSMGRLPFDDDSFDWVWSADCIGYPAGDLRPVLAECRRVVRPGGSINILAWTSQQVLPGYPLLEARLNAACSSYLPYLKGVKPGLHFLRALRGFREAGLAQVEARTFVGEVRAPLSEGDRAALTALLEMLWTEPTPEDVAEYRRVCRPESPEFILNEADYYGFFTYTLFRGQVLSKNNG
jgi:ubiquinone/menaquinone biosynthesis C-methylase UbiE